MHSLHGSEPVGLNPQASFSKVNSGGQITQVTDKDSASSPQDGSLLTQQLDFLADQLQSFGASNEQQQNRMFNYQQATTNELTLQGKGTAVPAKVLSSPGRTDFSGLSKNDGLEENIESALYCEKVEEVR